MAYDSKCRQLAKDFIADYENEHEEHKIVVPIRIEQELAQGIQDYIEDFLSDLEYDRIQELEATHDAAIERKMDERRLEGRK